MAVNGVELSWLCASAGLNGNLQEHIPVGEKLKNLLASTLLAASGNNETENTAEICAMLKCVCVCTQLVFILQ